MANKPRQLVLNAFFQRFGHHPAGWLHPSSTDNGRPNLDWYIRAAKLAEDAKFHAFFLADFIGQSSEVTGKSPNNYQFEPFTVQSAIASHTQHIGLVVTLNTNFNYPITSPGCSRPWIISAADGRLGTWWPNGRNTRRRTLA